ncbi:hypothetical protein ACS0TY_018798 [Phlomoides rotata]
MASALQEMTPLHRMIGKDRSWWYSSLSDHSRTKFDDFVQLPPDIQWAVSTGVTSPIEKRLEPRLRFMERKNLIMWPSLGTLCTLSEDEFFERFVKPYPDEVG